MLKQKKSNANNQGFALVELLIGVAVFLVIAVAVYDAYTSIFSIIFTSRAKIDAIDLVNEELEIVRNMPYSEVGIVGGIPSGVLLHVQSLVRDANQFTVTTTVRNIDDPFDGTLGGTPNDTSPADYKLVEIDIDCAGCRHFTPIAVTTRVSPKNLETASTNGALFIKVFDANGNPIQDANVHVQNNQVNPPIVVDDVTNAAGMLQIVDTPPGNVAYEITVTKAGYSTDKTYASTVGNQNPSNPHATVVLQQVTQVSFSIDKVSSLAINSETITCGAVPGVNFHLIGSKTIGSNPAVYKYDQNLVTNGAAFLSLSSLEWDSYSFTNTDPVYDLVGINPLSPVSLIPNSVQTLALIVAPKNPDTLLVTVKDGGGGLPVSGVDVTLSMLGMTSITNTTGQGFLAQTDWSGGGGQASSTDLTKYFSSDGNIETQNPNGDATLKRVFGDYVSSGVLTSSSFDTGGASNFQKIQWLPVDQPVGAGVPNVRIQIATNNDGATWNFTGPDGTVSTYYTVANQNIDSSHIGDRYMRYKMFLDTVATSSTPRISDVSFTFTSQCTPPGQVSFSGLSSGTYNLHFSKTGYASADMTVSVTNPWQSQSVTLLSN